LVLGWKPKTEYLKRRLTPQAESSPDHGAVSIPLCGMEELKESFWGDLYGRRDYPLDKP
jgi:hypothetical protein